MIQASMSATMDFINGMTLDQVIDKEVDVFLRSGSRVQAINFCRTFMQDGQVWVDLMPHVAGKYVMPLPDDAGISRNETDLGVARYGIFISPDDQRQLEFPPSDN